MTLILLDTLDYIILTLGRKTALTFTKENYC